MAESESRSDEAPIDAAIRLLTQWAEQIADSHTNSNDREDWCGEDEAKSDYDELQNTIAGLKERAPRSEQQQRQKEPPPGLLVSIALRLDHGLFMPNILTGETEEQHQRRIEVALQDARRAWEECSGNGFYSPEREAGYLAIRKDGIHALDLMKIPRPAERPEGG